jgi:hypothetical protein
MQFNNFQCLELLFFASYKFTNKVKEFKRPIELDMGQTTRASLYELTSLNWINCKFFLRKSWPQNSVQSDRTYKPETSFVHAYFIQLNVQFKHSNTAHKCHSSNSNSSHVSFTTWSGFERFIFCFLSFFLSSSIQLILGGERKCILIINVEEKKLQTSFRTFSDVIVPSRHHITLVYTLHV